MRLSVLFLVLIILLVLSGCESQTRILPLDSNPCIKEGNYCHDIKVDGGVSYLNFSSVAGGVFNYEVN